MDSATKLIRTRDSIGSQSVTYFIIRGTLLAAILLTAMVAYHWLALNHTSSLREFWIGIVSIAYVAICLALYRSAAIKLSAHLICMFYLCLSIYIAFIWGINVPFAILLFSFYILLNAACLGSKAIMPAAATVATALITLQVAVHLGLSSPNEELFAVESSFQDVFAYIPIFGIFALIGWLSRSRLEKTVNALEATRADLEIKNQQISNELQIERKNVRLAAIDEMSHLHQFAELGRNSTALLHDLANEVMLLSSSIPKSNDNRKNFNDARLSISKIEKLMQASTENIIRHTPEEFLISSLIDACIRDTEILARKHNVSVKSKITRTALGQTTLGEKAKLKQVIKILVSNAIESHIDTPRIKNRYVSVQISVDVAKNIVCKISDSGCGISEEARLKLFEEPKSTKKNGHGIGLYLARKIIQDYFHGSLDLEPHRRITTFTITLPTAS